VIKGVNAADPKICDNAKATINLMKKKRKKDNLDHKKKKNLVTANFADFDNESKKQIRYQVLQSVAVSSGDSTSITSSITGTGNAFSPGSGQGCGKDRGPVVFMYVVSILTTQTSSTRPILPVVIQSLLPHISLQFRTTIDNPNVPMIRCMDVTGAALNPGNYSFYAAVAKWYPHCVAKFFLPKDYSTIILLGGITR
jgi:hypothetical protein